VSTHELEDIFRDLPRFGELLKDRGYRQVWRFEAQGKPYYLKFYPRAGTRLKRLIRGNPAMREFVRLQLLQNADVPAPRPVTQLSGFRIGEVTGDAVVLHGIEPSVPLDHYLNDLTARGPSLPDRRDLAKQLVDVVVKLGLAKLGHNDLHLGNFLLHDGRLFLLDGYAVRPTGLRMNDVLQLWHGVSRYATRTDLLRGWYALHAGADPPTRNWVAERQYRKLIERATVGDNRYFGPFRAGAWSGRFFKQTKHARPGSVVSRLNVTSDDWAKAWPHLLEQIEQDQLTVLKRSRSGDVLAGEIVIGGKPVDVIVKRPRKRHWYRYVSEIGRSRPKRAWVKSWHLVARDLPTAWPMLFMEKRVCGYVTDSLIVGERIAGDTLAQVDLGRLSPDRREMLFRRTGRILRQIEAFGFAHFDAKANNWIVREDDVAGPTPVIIDADGIRKRRWTALGIRRLLRSMKGNPQYTPADSLALCQGYAPFAPMRAERIGGAES